MTINDHTAQFTSQILTGGLLVVESDEAQACGSRVRFTIQNAMSMPDFRTKLKGNSQASISTATDMDRMAMSIMLAESGKSTAKSCESHEPPVSGTSMSCRYFKNNSFLVSG